MYILLQAGAALPWDGSYSLSMGLCRTPWSLLPEAHCKATTQLVQALESMKLIPGS